MIPKILKILPSYIAGKRSFVAFTIYQMSGPRLFLVAQIYLIFYHCISRIVPELFHVHYGIFEL